jgi:hypothetical protein
MIWNKGQIDAHALPNNMLISADLEQKHVALVRNNSEYRERLEKAAKIAGYIPPVLTLARAPINKKLDIDALLRQNAKAERLTKGKKDEKDIPDNIILGGTT